MRLLDAARWRALAAEHEQRADRHGQPFVDRRSRGEKHPVEDFLFTYYTLSPGQLRRWHPGAGVILLDAVGRRDWKHYRPAVEDELRAAGLEADAARDIAAAGTCLLYTSPSPRD